MPWQGFCKAHIWKKLHKVGHRKNRLKLCVLNFSWFDSTYLQLQNNIICRAWKSAPFLPHLFWGTLVLSKVQKGSQAITLLDCFYWIGTSFRLGVCGKNLSTYTFYREFHARICSLKVYSRRYWRCWVGATLVNVYANKQLG